MNHGLKLHPDGTLEITMPKGKKVGRVLVCEAGTQNGSLYYPERDVLDTNDVIYRQDAIDTCKHAWAKGLEPSQYIEILPSAEPERKTGKWIHKHCVWFCSKCGENPTKGHGYVQGHDELYDFCPNCGAAMNQEVEECVTE